MQYVIVAMPGQNNETVVYKNKNYTKTYEKYRKLVKETYDPEELDIMVELPNGNLTTEF